MKHFRKLKLFFSKKTSESNVFKNMGILAIGVGSAQFIGTAITPILTRIYSPESFGILAVFMSVLGILGPFMTLRYSVPIPLLKQDGIAINLFLLTLFILFVITFIIWVVLSLFVRDIFDIFSINVLIPYWWLLLIALFGTGLYEVLYSWSIRQQKFKAISKVNVLRISVNSSIKIILGIMTLKSMGLIIATVFSSVFAALLLLTDNYKNIKINLKHIRVKRVKFLFYRYSDYPKYRLPSQFVLVVSQQAPLLFLAAFFTTDIVGYFGLTMTALSLPLSLFGRTTGQAYYAEISKIGRKNPTKIYELTIEVMKKLFLFSLVPFLILFITSPFLFGMVFGDQWSEAGIYTSIMSFYMLTAFVSAPLANALSVFNKQLVFLKLNVIRLILIGVIFFISWIFHLDATYTLIVYSVGMSLYYVYLTYAILSIIKFNSKIN